jgi:hypothetical protein
MERPSYALEEWKSYFQNLSKRNHESQNLGARVQRNSNVEVERSGI